MSDRPIIFSAPMIRALLLGRKRMTRRVLKAPKWSTGVLDFELGDDGVYAISKETGCHAKVPLPYAPGDRLWVRETWQTGFTADGPKISFRATPDYFKIDAWDGPDEGIGPSFNYDRCLGADFAHWLGDVLSNDGPWCSPIHMPRWASRLTLIVESVKVERLQEIKEDDAIAEGMVRDVKEGSESFNCWSGGIDYLYGWSARGAFMRAWELINDMESWRDNPWVVAISFKAIKANIDSFPSEEAA